MSLPVSSDATVTMTIHDYRAIERLVEDLRTEAETLRASQSSQPGGAEADAVLVAALQAALPIVQFAVGNLNPESVKGWPFLDVDRLSKHIAHLFKGDPDHETLAITLRTFAQEAREVEEFRKRREDAALQVLTASADDTDAESSTDGA